MAEKRYRLSPYCVLYPQDTGDGVIVINALYGSRFEASTEVLTVFAEIMNGGSLETALAAKPQELSHAIATLIDEKVLIGEDEFAEFCRQKIFKNRLDPVELAFHRGWNEGGFFPSLVDSDDPPARAKEAGAGPTIDLETWESLDCHMDLARCLERRRSIRSYGEQPLKKRLLEQFLQVTARANSSIRFPDLGWVSSRNYPSGGARYPLEIYAVIYNVSGIEEGIYRYCPFRHRLEGLKSEAEHRKLLLANARAYMGDATPLHGIPAVLFVVTAGFARTCWKYRGTPYHIILQETGALYQTMYLAATALELAPCALGAFPELALAELLHLDSLDEAQVGLFALGVPETSDTETVSFTITGVRLIEDSPFASSSSSKAVELAFGNGIKEVIDLDRLRLTESKDGKLGCRVIRGRYFAQFDESSRRQILQIFQTYPVFAEDLRL